MSNPAATRGSPISHHLRAAKKVLQDVILDVKIATTLDQAEFDVLEREAFEVLHLIRSWRSMVAPVNKIPPEILALVPDFLDPEDRDRGVIALTHVCHAWREVFVSRSSLWTDLDCADGERTRVYLERSKSSPIHVSLDEMEDISPLNPLFQVIPHAIRRLKSLYIETTPGNIQTITPHLSHPAPLLEHLIVDSSDQRWLGRCTLPSTLFNGDLSSLHTLYLDSVRTELPWRNMINLTSFTLHHTLPEEMSIGQLLDFLEGAPHLREVDLTYAIPTVGAQNGRLVSLVCLKSMCIENSRPSSILLDHLLIPVGARLTTHLHLSSSLIGEHLPRSLDNLKNLSNFTAIQLHLGSNYLRMEFSGPNGKVTAISRDSGIDWVLESLTRLDTSKTERLEINRADPLFSDSIYQALLPMTNLRTLTLSKCVNPHIFIYALHPFTNPSEVIACPKLEELILVLRANRGANDLDFGSVIGMAAARASRGEKLRTVRIVDGWGIAYPDVLELRKHVWNVEYGPAAGEL